MLKHLAQYGVDPQVTMSEYYEYDWRLRPQQEQYHQQNGHQNTTQDSNAKAMNSLRSLIQDCDDQELKNCPQDDKTLLKFLNSRKFDLEDSFEVYKNYYGYRRRNPELFRNLNLESEDILRSLENGLPGVLPCKDRKGRSVLVLSSNNWDTSNFDLHTIYRALLLSLEHLIQEQVNQMNGFVIIVDWTDFSFRQCTNLKPGMLRLMIEGLQDCFPARFKGIHFLAQPWYVEAALTVIKPFLNERIKERMYVHGNNLSTLHEHVHRDILPADMGGEKPAYNPRSWLDALLKAQQKDKETN